MKLFSLCLIFCFGSLSAAEVTNKSPAQEGTLGEDSRVEDQEESDLASKADVKTDSSFVEIDLGPQAKQQREQFLKILKTEVEAHLSRDDIDKLRRNVMRLGSYRADWSQEAQELVVANAPVAELVLYQFSLMKNARLNRRIRETLLSLSNLRYPSAVLAFLAYFMMSRDDIDPALTLLEKAVKQEPGLAGQALALVRGPLNDVVSLESRLKFSEGLCRRSQWPVDATEAVRTWLSSARTLWEKLLAADVAACLRK